MKTIIRLNISLGLMMLLAGCANLQIKVETYKGDLSNGGDSQLNGAVGAAEFCNASATQFVKRLHDDHCGHFDPELETDLTLVTDTFEHEQIEQLKQQMNTSIASTSADPSSRRALAIALLRYSQVCISVGQTIGLPARYTFLWPFREGPKETFITGVALEQTGRKIQLAAAGVLDGSAVPTLSQMLKSMDQGVIADTLLPDAGNLTNSLNSANWSYVNTITAGGIGDGNYVYVKDDVGNWVLKSVANDPTEVINAVFDSTTSMVNILGAQYGVHVNSGSDLTSSADTSQSNNLSNDPEVMADSAKKASTRLTQLQSNLKTVLQQYEQNDTDPTKLKADVLAAVTNYKAQVDAINYPGKASSTPTAAPSTPNSPAPANQQTPAAPQAPAAPGAGPEHSEGTDQQGQNDRPGTMPTTKQN